MNRCVSFTRILKLKSEIRLRRNVILGIETSCDDTGAAVLDLSGRIIFLHSPSIKEDDFDGRVTSVIGFKKNFRDLFISQSRPNNIRKWIVSTE